MWEDEQSKANLIKPSAGKKSQLNQGRRVGLGPLPYTDSCMYIQTSSKPSGKNTSAQSGLSDLLSGFLSAFEGG